MGEKLDDNVCVPCPINFYTFEIGPPDCNKCLENAECQGTTLLLANEGYWRSDLYSENLVVCLQNGCLGGLESECAEGYEGRLC